ncbi:hypothetical protein BJ912DRAFT_1064048 [Pholiota molesta]|nr:hypothetical protein BJ912DRAFT_1064048 [Pholiota molesta]
MFAHSGMSSPASSTSSGSSSSSIHHASLVDPATHSPALLELIDVKVSRQVIGKPRRRDSRLRHGTPNTIFFRGRTAARRPEHAKFTTFVENVLTRAEVTMSTLLATLVYIDRSKPHLHIGLEQWALERVFLGALIVASKYLNDSTLKNVHWALCTGVFGKRDVGRIEREYLDVLNFELKITEDDLLSHHQGLAEVITHLVHSPRISSPVPPAPVSLLVATHAAAKHLRTYGCVHGSIANEGSRALAIKQRVFERFRQRFFILFSSHAFRFFDEHLA